MTRYRHWTATGIVVLATATRAYSAGATPTSEEDQAARAIEKALQKHGGDVHVCFAKVLADRLDAAGKVEVAVEVGKGGKVTSAKAQKLDKSAGPALAACIEKAAMSWTLDGIEAGATVVLPFAFKAQTNQYVIHASDVPDRAMGAPAKGKPSGPKRDAPFTVKVLADQENVKADAMSLTLLSVGPASRVAMHRHPHSAKILYLVKGHARLLGPEGMTPIKIDEGGAAFIPAGFPHVIENMGRQSTAVFLQAFSPPGPERVYRDPSDARGRSEFEVIRDPAGAKAPTDGEAKVVSRTAAESKPVALPRGAGARKPLLDKVGQGMALDVLDLSDGAEIAGTTRASEIFFLVSGSGSLKVAGESSPLAAESTIYLPAGTGYVIKVAAAEKADKIVLVHVQAGGGAEHAPADGATPKK